MTENHPLNDELMEQIAHTCQWAGDIGDVVFCPQQLEDNS